MCYMSASHAHIKKIKKLCVPFLSKKEADGTPTNNSNEIWSTYWLAEKVVEMFVVMVH